jgi:adenylate cyclase class 2
MKDIEIEIKVKVESTKDLIKFLKKEAKFLHKSHQIDQYYTPFHRNFIAVRPTPEWLRLRNSDGKFSINYKNWHYDKNGKSHYCDEYETKVEDIEQMKQIFTALNIKPLVVVDKIRESYLYKDYEVALDSVKNLGKFVEVEFKGKSQNKKPEDICSEMVAFLKEHQCGTIKRNYVGYPFQLLFPQEINVEEY